MGLWAIVSMCMVATAMYGSAVAHRKVKRELFRFVLVIVREHSQQPCVVRLGKACDVSESFRPWATRFAGFCLGDSCPRFWSVSCTQREQLVPRKLNSIPRRGHENINEFQLIKVIKKRTPVRTHGTPVLHPGRRVMFVTSASCYEHKPGAYRHRQKAKVGCDELRPGECVYRIYLRATYLYIYICLLPLLLPWYLVHNKPT